LLVFDQQAPTEDRIRHWFHAGAAVMGLRAEVLTDAAAAGGSDAVRTTVARVRGWVRKARGQKLFQGVEHVGLYEHNGASAAEITAWYRDTFEWEIEEGRAYYFAAGDGPGRIEIMKVGKTDRCHLAIKVADLDEATAYLAAKGIDLVPPETRPDGRRIFFTVTDPAGNILHLLP
jgi:predicted enzyme related to lactoylglutathione lyase